MRRPVLIALMWSGVLGVGAQPAESEPGPARASRDPRPGTSDSGPFDTTVEVLQGELRLLRERLERLEDGLGSSQRALGAPTLPATMAFAGEAVPLDRWDVAERLERELVLSAGNRPQVVLWLKRSARYFPFIEAALRRVGLPDDLKYVAVIESSLLPTVQSHASALGIWQFIATTGRRYGLIVTSSWDDRRNPEASTAAALAYLRDLHGRFRDWPLALAGYNAGEGRVEQALRAQGVTTYYQLSLAVETERYVFRALAAKLILAEPERYGFQLSPERLYRPQEADLVEVRVRDRVAVAELARAGGSFYRELRELNAEIAQDQLPRGDYRLRVPKGRAGEFVAGLARGLRAVTARVLWPGSADETARATARVKPP